MPEIASLRTYCKCLPNFPGKHAHDPLYGNFLAWFRRPLHVHCIWCENIWFQILGFIDRCSLPRRHSPKAGEEGVAKPKECLHGMLRPLLLDVDFWKYKHIFSMVCSLVAGLVSQPEVVVNIAGEVGHDPFNQNFWKFWPVQTQMKQKFLKRKFRTLWSTSGACPFS